MLKILFICATHGDESFSISVLKQLEKEFSKENYGYDWVIGNPRALSRRVRYTEKDLNRSAPGCITSKVYEEKRAAELLDIAKEYDVVIDIHGTHSNCGIVSIIPKPTAQNLRLAVNIPTSKKVIWYSVKSDIVGPLAQHTGCPALEIECGPQNSKYTAEKLKCVLRATIQANIEGLLMREQNMTERSYYKVYDKQEGPKNPAIKDFHKTTVNGESFYPFLSGQYDQIACYKMKLVSVAQVLPIEKAP